MYLVSRVVWLDLDVTLVVLQALRSTYSARWARSQLLWAWRWSRCTGWSGSGRIRSSRATRWRCAERRRSSPSACCRPASAPPYPPETTGWWAWVSLKQGTPAPPSRPPAPPEETFPAARSGSEELRKRKTEEGLIRGSRKAADGAVQDGQCVSVCLWAKHGWIRDGTGQVQQTASETPAVASLNAVNNSPTVLALNRTQLTNALFYH